MAQPTSHEIKTFQFCDHASLRYDGTFPSNEMATEPPRGARVCRHCLRQAKAIVALGRGGMIT